jgi:hypothetical protein
VEDPVTALTKPGSRGLGLLVRPPNFEPILPNFCQRRTVGPIVIPDSETQRFGIHPGQVKFAEELGGGFPANVEVLTSYTLSYVLYMRSPLSDSSQNLIRQSLWFNYHYYLSRGEGAFKNPTKILIKHVGKS